MCVSKELILSNRYSFSIMSQRMKLRVNTVGY